MVRYFILIACCCLWLSATAQKFQPIDRQSEVSFSIRNFGITVNGKFTGLKGEIGFDTQQPSKSFFNVSVNASSVDTGIQLRDKHLRSEDFFNANVFPLFQFKSTEISSTKVKDSWRVKGVLIMKGDAKECSFPFTVFTEDNEMLMSGAFNINRRDFKIGGSSIGISDSVQIRLKVRLRQTGSLSGH